MLYSYSYVIILYIHQNTYTYIHNRVGVRVKKVDHDSENHIHLNIYIYILAARHINIHNILHTLNWLILILDEQVTSKIEALWSEENNASEIFLAACNSKGKVCVCVEIERERNELEQPI
jgi:hypothetical protein